MFSGNHRGLKARGRGAQTPRPHFEPTCVNRKDRMTILPTGVPSSWQARTCLPRGSSLHAGEWWHQPHLRLEQRRRHGEFARVGRGLDCRLGRLRVFMAGAHRFVRPQAMGSGRVGAARSAHHRHVQRSSGAGSAMGGRANAAIEAKDAEDGKAKARAAWDAAKAELDNLTTAKPAAELQSLIDSAKIELAKFPAAAQSPRSRLPLRAARRDRIATAAPSSMARSRVPAPSSMLRKPVPCSVSV